MSSEVRAVKVKGVFSLTKLLFVFIKHSQIMSVRVRFYDSTESDEITFLECRNLELLNVIGIRIDDSSYSIPILLDKQTAIKLVRELRRQIALLD
jgi:hypothetical protein